MTKFKMLLLGSASAVAMTAGSAAYAIDVDQYTPFLNVSPTNTQSVISGDGPAHIHDMSQTVANTANQFNTNIYDDLDIEQLVGEEDVGFLFFVPITDDSTIGVQTGTNTATASATDGSAEIDGSQAVQNVINAITVGDIDQGFGSDIDIVQQAEYGQYSDQSAFNDATASATGFGADASLDVTQTGRNFLNTVAVQPNASGDNGTSEIDNFNSEQYFVGPSSQLVENTASADTTSTGDASVTADQVGVNVANTVNVDNNQFGIQDGDIDIEQTASRFGTLFDGIDDPSQTVTNTIDASAAGGSIFFTSVTGDVDANVSQDAINQTNMVTVAGEIDDLNIDQVAVELEQTATNSATVGATGGNGFFPKDATITLDPSVEGVGEEGDDNYVAPVLGGGQIALNTANAVTLTDAPVIDDFDLNQETDGFLSGGPVQIAENTLSATAGSFGDATINAEGSRGQVAFNTLNSLTGDLSNVQSDALNQSAIDNTQTASNMAEALSTAGYASINGLSQLAGSSVNTVNIPSTPAP